MQKTVQQIPLNFGEEPEVPSPVAKEDNGTGDHEKQYMAAAGVVVRVKSYKNPRPAAAPNVELFPAEVLPAVEIPALVEVQPAVEAVETVEPIPTPAATPEMQTVTVAPAKPPRKEQRRTPAGKTAAPKAGPSKRGRKSLKQVAAEADLIDIPTDEVLFSKQYYSMGEVAEMFRVNQSLLRFWETEFDILQPKKNKKGDRHFRPVDIKNLHLIYHLLRQKKYTIEGAKDFLRKNKKADERFEVIQRLQQIKGFLLEWKAQL
jgi:DNA-binding transcriptional MerR regulator